ncbi:MAG TPA: sterol desaturase family protein, partial [Chitinophagaceae bacterium]
METYGRILLIAMPVFLTLVLLEQLYGWVRFRTPLRGADTISSLSSGITNVTKDVLGLSISLLTYDWLVRHVAVLHIGASWLTYVVAFVCLDFAGYWMHRWSHRLNLFWNLHLIHHSSEEFNLACALRQSISEIVKVFAFLLLPAALLGVPTIVIATIAPLHLFAQFWYHTQYIGKMGPLEKIIVTPSHHRVHHAMNAEYIDKNLGQIFIFWDKLFGTYQPELADIRPAYGITRPAATWNPIRINFQHLWLLIADAWHTKSWREKFTLWFRPTGYRPGDVQQRRPVKKVEDVSQLDKYAPAASTALLAWSWFQLVITLVAIAYLFGNIAYINRLAPSYIYVYGAFIFLSVYSFTELMDRSRFASAWELLKNCYGAAVIIFTGDWF